MQFGKIKKAKSKRFQQEAASSLPPHLQGTAAARTAGKKKEKGEKSSAKHVHRERREGDCAPHQCAWGGSGPSRQVLLERSELGDVDDSVPEYLSVVCRCLGWCLGSFPNLGPPL